MLIALATTVASTIDIPTAHALVNFESAVQLRSVSSSPQFTDVEFNRDGSKMFTISNLDNSITRHDLVTNYDVSTATLDQTFTVYGASTNTVEDVTFSRNGLKMFVAGSITDPPSASFSGITEYTLTTAFDLSTVNNNTAIPFSTRTVESSPKGVAFSFDGLRMFIVGPAQDGAVHQYNLGRAYTLAGDGVHDRLLTSELTATNPQGIAFSNNGDALFILGSDTDSVIKYDLDPSYDLDDAIISGSFSVASQDTQPQGMTFSTNGRTLFMVGLDTSNINRYDIGVDFDITDVTFNQDTILYTFGLDPTDVEFANNGFLMFTVVDDSDFVTKYELTSAYDVSTASATDSFFIESFVESATSDPQGVTFSNDGLTMFVVINSISEADNRRVIQYRLTSAFDISNPDRVHSMTLTSPNPLRPDGITFSDNGESMFIVGDGGSDNHVIITFDLMDAFDISRVRSASLALSFVSDADGDATRDFHDLEFVDDGNTLFVIYTEERPTDNDTVRQYSLSSPYDLSDPSRTIVNSLRINATETDVRGIAFSDNGTKMFITGKSSDMVHEYTLPDAFSLGDTARHVMIGAEVGFSVNVNVNQQIGVPRGMEFSSDGLQLFVVGANNMGADRINAYTLDSPFDMATANYTYTAPTFQFRNFTDPNILHNISELRDISFSHNGSVVYITHNTPGLESPMTQGTGLINLYNLSTPYNLDTASDSIGYLSTPSDVGNVEGVHLSMDGSNLYTVGQTGQNVWRFIIGGLNDFAGSRGFPYTTTNVQMSTQFNNARDDVLHSIPGNRRDITLSPDGHSMFIVGSESNHLRVFQYDLPNPFVLRQDRGISYTDNYLVPSIDDTMDIEDVAFSNDGLRMFLLIQDNGEGLDDAVHQYDLSSRFNVLESSADYVGSIRPVKQSSFPTSVVFIDDGRTMISANADHYRLVGEGRFNTAKHHALVEYTLETPFDVSSVNATDVMDFEPLLQGGRMRDMGISDDGTHLNILGDTYPGIVGTLGVLGGTDNDRFVEYPLTTAFDVSTSDPRIVLTKVVTHSSDPLSFTWNNDEDVLAITHGSDSNDPFMIEFLNARSAVNNNVGFNNIGFASGDRFDAGINQMSGIAFNQDDTRMFVLSNGNDMVYIFDIARPISLVLNGTSNTFYLADIPYLVGTFSVALQDDDPQDIVFSDTGGSMYIVGNENNKVYQYSLPTNFDLFGMGGIGFDGFDSLSLPLTSPQDIEFSDDGLTMFVLDDDIDSVIQYSLSKSFDTSTAMPGASLSIADNSTIPSGISLDSDGNKMYVLGGNDVFEYNLTTAFDISTARFDFNFSVPGDPINGDGRSTDIELSNDGSKMFILGDGNDRVLQYDLSTDFNVSTASDTLGSHYNISLPERTNPIFASLKFSNTGDTMFILERTDDIVYQFALDPAFDITSPQLIGNFSTVIGNDVSAETPRGITFSDIGDRIFVVDSETANVNTHVLPAFFDISSPVFTANRTSMDTIVLTFGRLVNTTSTDGTSWLVSGSGSRVTSNTVAVTSTVDGTLISTITLTTSGISGTGATPTVTYLASSNAITYVNGSNSIAVRNNDISITSVESIAPVVQRVLVTNDTTVEVTISENIMIDDGNPITATDFELDDGTAIFGLASVTIVNDDTLVIRTSGDVNNIISDSAVLTLSYTRSTVRITDTNNNTLADFMRVDVSNNDNTPPTLDSAKIVTPTRIDVIFSENLNGATIFRANFEVEGSIVTSAVETSSGIVTLTLETALSPGTLPRITVTRDIEDNGGNPLTGRTSITIPDTLPPTFTATRNAVNQITLTFDQDVTFESTVSDFRPTSTWSISTGVVTLWTTSTTKNVIITYSSDTLTDSTPTVTFNNASGNITDADGNAAVDGTSTVAIDGTAPILDVASISSDNSQDPMLAMPDNVITLSFETSESILGIPRVTIAGMTAKVTNTTSTTWIANITVTGRTVEGPVTFRIQMGDALNNNADITGSIGLDGSRVSVGTAPSIIVSAFTVTSNNTNPLYAKLGDTIDIVFIAQGNVNYTDITSENVMIFGRPVTPSSIMANATAFMLTDIPVRNVDPEGPIEISLRVRDTMTDNIITFTQDDLTTGSNVIVDTMSPRYVDDSGTVLSDWSINISFDEPVINPTGMFPSENIRYPIFPNGLPESHPVASSGYGSNTILLDWEALNDAGVSANAINVTEHTILFNISAHITDLAGNPIDETRHRNFAIPPIASTTDSSILDLTDRTANTQDGFVDVTLDEDTFIRIVDLSDPNKHPRINLVDIRGQGAGDDGHHFDLTSLTINSAIGRMELPQETIFIGFNVTDDIPDQIQISPASFDPNLNQTSLAFSSRHHEYMLSNAYVVEFGNPTHDLRIIAGEGDIAANLIIKLTTYNVNFDDRLVFSIDSNEAPRQILACPDNALGTNVDNPVLDRQVIANYLNSDNVDSLIDSDACFIGQDIWTKHLSRFASVARGARDTTTGGTGGCDNCTPPTLGYNSRGQQLVSNGFSYNDNPTNVEYYFTPYPLITTEVGQENVAVFKIYDDQGPDHIMHFSMAFGLRTGDVVSQSKVVIEYDIDFQKNATVTITDPENAIDDDTVRVDTELVSCMEDTANQCLQITIHHTFRAPLDFDIVASDVWDTKRNAWQNYYNHGIHITGVSMNPIPGILVNNDTLRLYPLVVDSTHVQVMVDADNHLYKLTPDGSYHPLRNVYSLFHEIDESMYIVNGQMPNQGYDRRDSQFMDDVHSQIELAQDAMYQMLRREIVNEEFHNMGNRHDSMTDSDSQYYFDEAEKQKIRDKKQVLLHDAMIQEQLKAEELFKILFEVKHNHD